MRGLRFCAIALKPVVPVDSTLLFRTSTVFALNTLNTSTMARSVDLLTLKVRAARRSVFHRLS